MPAHFTVDVQAYAAKHGVEVYRHPTRQVYECFPADGGEVTDCKTLRDVIEAVPEIAGKS